MSTTFTAEELFTLISHDLRTPLRTVGNFAELLSMYPESGLDELGKEWVKEIINASSRAQEIINGLLELVNLEANNHTDVEMVKVFHAAMSQVLSNAMSKQGTVHYEGELYIAHGNFTQLVSVLRNLISNALKYNTEDVPNVTFYATKREGVIQYCVADNGDGVPEEAKISIFKPAVRAHTEQNWRQGAGLGLSFVKKIIEELHHGKVWVEANEPKGSKFFFTLKEAV